MTMALGWGKAAGSAVAQVTRSTRSSVSPKASSAAPIDVRHIGSAAASSVSFCGWWARRAPRRLKIQAVCSGSQRRSNRPSEDAAGGFASFCAGGCLTAASALPCLAAAGGSLWRPDHNPHTPTTMPKPTSGAAASVSHLATGWARSPSQPPGRTIGGATISSGMGQNAAAINTVWPIRAAAGFAAAGPSAGFRASGAATAGAGGLCRLWRPLFDFPRWRDILRRCVPLIWLCRTTLRHYKTGRRADLDHEAAFGTFGNVANHLRTAHRQPGAASRAGDEKQGLFHSSACGSRRRIARRRGDEPDAPSPILRRGGGNVTHDPRFSRDSGIKVIVEIEKIIPGNNSQPKRDFQGGSATSHSFEAASEGTADERR